MPAERALGVRRKGYLINRLGVCRPDADMIHVIAFAMFAAATNVTTVNGECWRRRSPGDANRSWISQFRWFDIESSMKAITFSLE